MSDKTAAARWGSRRTVTLADCLSEAGVLVVQDLAALSKAVKWRLALQGGTVVHAALLLEPDSCSKGVLHYAAAVRSMRLSIWASAEFSTTLPGVCDLLDEAMSAPGSKWSWFVATSEEYVQRCAGSSARPTVGLLTRAERDAWPKGLGTVHTARSFLSFITSAK